MPNVHSAEAAYKQAQRNTINTSSKLKTPLLPPLGGTVLDPYDLRNRIVGEEYFFCQCSFNVIVAHAVKRVRLLKEGE